ncbi:acetyl-CoA carboxylase biotin carboxyl carrier protein subunit [Dyadobacter sp. CY323]|uniref:acetyl-CoA carboxylase biotin carboxyl carrier protein subunit n=1 Tax=Dyadobacter sp. CY323 TaxID=2907302 RepID=UPI001F47D7E0|nr:acetyl-CoA carboxylase biotin carboxyl carrier protein subunit [Dyadobacter sp. CY323]MCE6990495.1 acetyl-CoA carboxylase biotin carboxyl carrier protein subunit [Dyadobacter sp. CY323]
MLKVDVSNSQDSEENGASNKNTFEIDQTKTGWLIDKALFDGDIEAIAQNRYHVIWKNKSYNIEILEKNPLEKSVHLLINGVHFYTSAKNRLDLLLEGMGLEGSSAQKINNVKAPMPGLIQSIAVSEGDHLSKGDTLLVLVAMKMENIIKASGNGVVKSIKVASGEIVEKNQVLLEFQ